MLRLSPGLARHGVLITCAVPADVLERLDRYFEVDVHDDSRPLSSSALAARLQRKAGAIVTPADVIGSEVLESVRGLRAVCSVTGDCDHLDLDRLTQAGVLVTNTPFACGAAPEAAHRAADNLIAALGFGRIGGRPPDLRNPELLCDCC